MGVAPIDCTNAAACEFDGMWFCWEHIGWRSAYADALLAYFPTAEGAPEPWSARRLQWRTAVMYSSTIHDIAKWS